MVVFFAKSCQGFISVCEDRFLAPSFDSFNSLALIWVGLDLLLLLWGFIVLLCTFFVLLFYLLLRFDSQHKLLLSEIEECTSNCFPLLLDISLTISIYVQSFLLH